MTKLKEENNILDTNYLSELDKKVKLLPITFDPVFKGIFGSNIDLLKDFILSVLEIDIDRDKCKIRLLNNELPIENYKEYKKTVYLSQIKTYEFQLLLSYNYHFLFKNLFNTLINSSLSIGLAK